MSVLPGEGCGKGHTRRFSEGVFVCISWPDCPQNAEKRDEVVQKDVISSSITSCIET